jgi:hypothetical protein
VAAEQVAEDLAHHQGCPDCGARYTSRSQGSTPVQTVFGRVRVPNPRWHRCPCQAVGPETFRPTAT